MLTQKFTPIISLIVLLIMLVATGCTSTQSAGPLQKKRKSIEHVEVVFIPGISGESSDSKKIDAVPVVVGYAVDGALKLAEYLINREAKKYEAIYSANTLVTLKGVAPRLPDRADSEWGMKEGGMIVMIRSVEVEKAIAVEERLEALLGEMKSELEFGQALSDKVIGKLKIAKEDNQRITFIGVFEVNPNSFDVKSESKCGEIASILNIQMRGYYYAALKAKSVNNGRGVWGLFKTKSIATIEIKGPAADYRYDGGQYKAAGVFPLLIKECNKWQWYNPKKNSNWISETYRIPASEEITIVASVRETTKMKKLLNDLAKKTGAIEIDVDEWFSDGEN
ncbi:hypothetical protein COB72_01200 [bacterium]|nr:MAG: hypothetical protein COB72_01200 [bacterium]